MIAGANVHFNRYCLTAKKMAQKCLPINLPTEYTKNQVEHEKRPDNDQWNKINPIEIYTQRIIRLKNYILSIIH